MTLFALLIFLNLQYICNSKAIDSLEYLLKSSSGKERVDVLLDLSYRLKNDDGERAFKLANEALSLCQNLKLPDKTARAYFCMGVSFQERGNPQRALEYYELYRLKAISNGDKKDEGEAYFQEGTTYYDQGDIVNAYDRLHQAYHIYSENGFSKRASDAVYNCGIILMEQGSYEKALSDYKTALSLIDSLKYPLEYSNIYSMMGSTYSYKGDYLRAIDYMTKGMIYDEGTQNKWGMLTDYNNIAGVYKKAGMHSKAIEYFKKELLLGLGFKEARSITDGYLGIASVYEDQKKLDSSRVYIEKCIQYVSGLEDQSLFSKAYVKLAYIYLSQNKYDSAFSKLNIAIDIYKKLNKLTELCEAYDMLTQAYISKKDYKNALINANNLLEVANNSSSLIKVQECHFLISEIYEKLNDDTKALYYYKLGSRLRDSLLNADKLLQISNLENDLKIEQKEKESSILKLELSKQSTIRNYLIVISVLVILIALGIWNRYNFKKKQNIMLEEKNDQLNKANIQIDNYYKEKIQLQEEAHSKESQIMKLNNEILQNELEMKHKELTALAINLVDKNEYLMKLKEQAESIGKAKPDEVGPLVRMIIRSINVNARGEESWQVFETQFKAIHRGFMEFITAQYPDLIVTELKICTLLKINLSSKEISSLLNLSIRTVEDYRLKIRKKMGLDSEMNLNQYIASLNYK